VLKCGLVRREIDDWRHAARRDPLVRLPDSSAGAAADHSVAYYLPQPRILFTGDTIARSPTGTVMLGVFNVDPGAAAASCRRLAELDAETACFGHGAPLTDTAAAALHAAAG
jgi:glyoxylase-like metal-dependent hydrolase (beta-lactamase superfamily II)